MFGKRKSADALKNATPRQLLDALAAANAELMVEYVAEHRPDAVIAMWTRKQKKPVGFDELELRFVDSDGRKYYGFPKSMPIPIARYAKMRDFEMWMTVGMTPDEIGKIADALDKATEDFLRTKKGHSRIGALITELKMRREMVVHTELIFNYLAVQFIREDENVEAFDPSIQDEKVATFKRESSNGSHNFFFVQPEFRRWNELFNFTPHEWETYWNESMSRQRKLGILLDMINGSNQSSKSKSESPNETRISAPE